MTAALLEVAIAGVNLDSTLKGRHDPDHITADVPPREREQMEKRAGPAFQNRFRQVT